MTKERLSLLSTASHPTAHTLWSGMQRAVVDHSVCGGEFGNLSTCAALNGRSVPVIRRPSLN
jgi:hypothetical protein